MENRKIKCWFYHIVCFVIFSSSVKAGKLNGDCRNMDVTGTPESLNQLKGCKVIKGNLRFALIQQNVTRGSYENYKFPELREITGFFKIHANPELTSLNKLFPNLTVIRGRQLFLNYAFSIYSMKDLQTIGLKSLVAIQNGYVFIHRNPKLCYLKKINWDRLVVSHGYNHIKYDTSDECNETCSDGCNYCWSSSECQRFDSDLQKEGNCHPQCLGGCYNTTAQGCVVCRELTDHGTCVNKCPPNMFVSQDHARCYTRKECSKMFFYIYKNECVEKCPAGYNYMGSATRREVLQGNASMDCTLCNHACNYTCQAHPIFSLAASEHYKNCRIVNGSIVIRIPEPVSIAALENLSEIREIQGSLRIYETPSLTNMSMFKHLTKIYGDPMDYKKFGLVFIGNRNLKKLWDWNEKKILYLNGTGILMHSNYKLCNVEILRLLQTISNETRELDEIEYNEEEVGCDPVTIATEAVVNSHDSATLSWKITDTADNVRIFYTEVDYKNTTINVDEMEDHCQRVIWASEFRLKDELEQNSTHFYYTITSLKQNSKYGYFIKSFNEGLGIFAQSKIEIFTTLADIPMSPVVYTQNKSTNSIELAWFYSPDEDFENQRVTYYMVDIFVHWDNQQILDQRDYCTDPIKPIDMATELLDYDNCCHVLEYEKEELEFNSFVDQKFRCTLDDSDNCDVIRYNTREKRSTTENDVPEAYKSEYYVRSQHIPANANSTVIDGLEYFTFYVFQFFACNEQGCGPYYLHSDRTAPNKEADQIEDVQVSMNPSGSKYEYHVHITPPKHPNGVVLLYNIYFLRGVDKYTGDVKCLPRLYFANMNYNFKEVYDISDFNISVRVQSLAGPGKASDWKKVYLSESGLSWDWSLVMFLALFTVFFVIAAWSTRHYKLSDAVEWCRQIRNRATPLSTPIGDDDDEEILMERMHDVDFDRDDDTRGINEEHFI